ncbi:protein FAM174C [Gastrophryne carolinensis]
MQMEIWSCACSLSFILLVVDSVSALENSTNATTEAGPTVTGTAVTTIKMSSSFWNNYEMMQRAFYVLIGISVLAVLYFVIRTFSLKKKPQRKKYGLLSDYDENMEMGSMDSDEDKIFESRNIRR